ncbi:hypothetical protein GJV26_18335 [Massilia dura]|uniref:DUF4148 domain-containing protein n=1 Tax=Pseudoduganella dura TaxID=321982 RepID=A0A6I3XIQ6_9BURK|nr:hypothetical protein [Pseudoduganella dura]MUI14400.1 hypothetical protein [Pseudoduganella dura]GGY05637.1 hypothetical protein GCM10007386_40440 [Pseudoduganella dura]
MKQPIGKAWALALCVCVCPLVQAEPANKAVAAETKAARDARLEREAVAAKQTEIFERKNISLPNEAAPAMLLDAPVDETDSPGATKQ